MNRLFAWLDRGNQSTNSYRNRINNPAGKRRLGLTDETLAEYEETKRNHASFILEQLLFENTAFVPCDSLAWIVPAIRDYPWRRECTIRFATVEWGVQITMQFGKHLPRNAKTNCVRWNNDSEAVLSIG